MNITQKVVNRYLQRTATTVQYIDVKDLPEQLKSVLNKIHYTPRNIGVIPAEKFSMYCPGGEGNYGISVLVNLATGKYSLHEGEFGGGGSWNKENLVDTDHGEQPMHEGIAVIQGNSKGSGVWYAKLYVHPNNLTGMLTAEIPLSREEKLALKAIDGLNSRGRKDEFSRLDLGEYGPNNPLLLSLAAKGLILIKKSGVTITTLGQNQPGISRY